MARTSLTALAVQKIKPPVSGRAERYDPAVPGFGVRTTVEGSKSWIFVYTSPTQKKRRRYTIGIVDFKSPDGETTLDLEQARSKANDLRRMVREGYDPAAVRETTKAAVITEARAAEGRTFGAVVDLYKKRDLVKKRRGWEVKRIIDRELIPHWGDKPIGAITAMDVHDRVEALVEAEKPEAARRLFEIIRRIFNWAIARPSYKLERSPADRMKPVELIGKKTKRKRVLTNDELRALWQASKRTGYPFGPMIRMLMLTALRLNDAAKASRSEFDVERKLWTIPAERMKGEEDESGPHVVPLNADMLEIFEALPRFSSGDFLFSTGDGKRPVSGFSKTKRRLDKLMLEELRKIAAERDDQALLAYVLKVEDIISKIAKARGDEQKELRLELKRIWWANHDIRRSVRTHLSALPVQQLVRELILAHAQPELDKIYDQFKYVDEKREALELWAARLKLIVDPPPSNVVALRA
jgi:Arm DNA-binding domain/Phage integrase family